MADDSLEQIGNQLGRFQGPKSERMTYRGQKQFEDIYQQIKKIHYVASVSEVEKIFFPTSADAITRCAICFEPKEKLKFEKEAHVIPACLGNEIYFSNEECDSCNEKMGIKFDGHFGAMTAPMRGFFRLPNRDGSAKWTVEGSPSFIGYDPVRGISISIGDPGNPLSQKLDKEKSSVEITGPVAPFKPARAIGSLIHSCWLMLNEAQRARHTQLHEILCEKHFVEPFVFYSGLVPIRNPHKIQFEIYENKTADLEFPDLVIRAFMGQEFWVWGSPSKAKSSYVPFPLPPINVLEMNPKPSCNGCELKSFEYEDKGKRATIGLAFSGLQEGEVKMDLPPEVKKKKSVRVTLITKNSGKSHKAENLYLRLVNMGSSNPFFILTGQNFTARIVMPMSEDLSKPHPVRFEIRTGRKRIVDVFQSMQILENIARPGTELLIALDSGQPILQMDVPTQETRLSFQDIISFSGKLIDLEKRFSVNFRFPSQERDEDSDWVDWLHDRFVKGGVADESGQYEFNLQVDTPLASLEDWRSKKEALIFSNPGGEMKLFDAKFLVPPHRWICEKLDIVTPRQAVFPAGTKLTLKYFGVRYAVD